MQSRDKEVKMTQATIARREACPGNTIRGGYAAGRDGVPKEVALHLEDCEHCNQEMFPEHRNDDPKYGQSDHYKKGHQVWCKQCQGN